MPLLALVFSYFMKKGNFSIFAREFCALRKVLDLIFRIDFGDVYERDVDRTCGVVILSGLSTSVKQ